MSGNPSPSRSSGSGSGGGEKRKSPPKNKSPIVSKLPNIPQPPSTISLSGDSDDEIQVVRESSRARERRMLRDAQDEIIQLKTKIAKLESHNSVLENDILPKKESEIRKLLEQKEQDDIAKQSDKDLLQGQIQEVKKLSKENKKFDSELKSQQQRVQDVEGERDVLQNKIVELESLHQQQLKEVEAKASATEANLRKKVAHVESAKNELVSQVASLEESLRVNDETLESVREELEDVVRKGVEKEGKVKKLVALKRKFLSRSEAIIQYFQEIVNSPDNDVGDENGEEMEASGNSTFMDDSTPIPTSIGPRRAVSMPARSSSPASSRARQRAAIDGKDRPVICEICHRGFTSQQYLKAHITRKHTR